MISAIKSNGFSLIELLIVISIVAILAGIAIPSYDKYTRSAKRTEGRVGLISLAGQMERFYTDNGNYSDATLTGLLDSDKTQPNGYYTLTINDQQPDSYRLQATPNFKDTCTALYLDNTGRKTSAPQSATRCWQ